MNFILIDRKQFYCFDENNLESTMSFNIIVIETFFTRCIFD